MVNVSLAEGRLQLSRRRDVAVEKDWSWSCCTYRISAVSWTYWAVVSQFILSSSQRAEGSARMKQRCCVVRHADDGRRTQSYSARNARVVGGLRSRWSLGPDENYEVAEFTIIHGHREFRSCCILAFTMICRDFSRVLHFCVEINKFLMQKQLNVTHWT